MYQQIGSSKLQKEKVKYLIIHHTASATASPEDIHRWHLEKGFGGFGYNEYIQKDGTLVIGRGDSIGAHCKGYNHISYGICLEGNFEKEHVTSAQWVCLIQRCREVMKRYPTIKEIKMHRELGNTKCPGKNFPNELLLSTVADEKNSTPIPSPELQNILDILVAQGIVTDRAYWERSLVAGGSVKSEYVQLLLERIVKWKQ